MANAKKSEPKASESKTTKSKVDDPKSTNQEVEDNEVESPEVESEKAEGLDPDEETTPVAEKTSSKSKPESKSKRKRSKKWIIWVLLIILFSAAAAGAAYKYEQRKANRDHDAQAAQITALNSEIASLKQKSTDLQGQVNTLQSSTTDLDQTAISTRVKYVYTQWLGNVGHDQTSLISSLKNGNYLTAAASSALQAGMGGQSDPVICSQNPATSYNYASPIILTTTAASMVVTGNYSNGQNVAINLALVKVVNTWEIDSISCP